MDTPLSIWLASTISRLSMHGRALSESLSEDRTNHGSVASVNLRTAAGPHSLIHGNNRLGGILGQSSQAAVITCDQRIRPSWPRMLMALVGKSLLHFDVDYDPTLPVSRDAGPADPRRGSVSVSDETLFWSL